MDPSEDTRHPIRNAFRALSAWQKVAIVITGLLFAPWAIWIAIISALSFFPFFLFGRLEGTSRKDQLEHDVEQAMRDQRRRTQDYYGGT